MPELNTIIDDLREEGAELHQLLSGLNDADWNRVTRFKNWTINDVVAHLYFGDYLGCTSHRSGAEFKAFMAQVTGSGLTLADFTRQWLDGLSGPAMLDLWYRSFKDMCTLFAASDPSLRLTWAGPDMGIAMFTTARLMETWAHAWAIYDLLEAPRPPSDRIHHIATIGVKTYAWTFANRKLSPPGPPPHVVLDSPSGQRWEWNTPQADNRVRGQALEFCQVVTQVRSIADTALELRGDAARQWMDLAQCFAGPPETPPKPGWRGPGPTTGNSSKHLTK